MRVLLIIAVAWHLLFASFEPDNISIEHHIVKSLDIPLQFLHTEKFLKLKKKYERYTQHHFFDVNRVETYFVPDLVRIMNAYNIPDVFLFMAMAESNFATHARSIKRAVGIWQFMPQTARKYGLRVDTFVDERKDPYKSTRAAIKYLRNLYTMFGKWYLAALAYNAGEGKVLRAIQRAGTDDVMVLVDERKKYLPKESREYLYRIVMLALMANDRRYSLNADLAYILTRGEEYEIMPVKVKGAESLLYVSEKIKLNYKYLRHLNPHLKRGYTPPNVKKYAIYIPKIKYADFKKYYKPSKNRAKGFLAYRVRKGDSLYTIARKFGVKVALLKRFNKLRANLIHPGQRLIIPLTHKLYKKKRGYSYKNYRRRIYRVRKGDTILKIAKKFGVNAKKLKKWNNKKSNFLKIGERLVVLY